MIRVKLYNLLAERSLSGKEEYEIAFEDGLRPVDIIHREGFHGEEEEAIVVLINDEQGTRGTLLSDGDRVELMIGMVGGSAPLCMVHVGSRPRDMTRRPRNWAACSLSGGATLGVTGGRSAANPR